MTHLARITCPYVPDKLSFVNRPSRIVPPDGTRFVLAHEAQLKTTVISQLQALYKNWGYQAVDVPSLEHYDSDHPRAHQSFKFADRDAQVLSLRSDFTPSVSQLVLANYGDSDLPLRLQYCGNVWQSLSSDISGVREFTQIGLELVGISNARADAELIHLARESIRTVGLAPRVELGNPSLVKVLFDLADIAEDQRDVLADSIDRKDQRSLETLLNALELSPDLHKALLSIPDLYGDIHILKDAHQLAPWPETKRELDRLDEILSEFEDSSELLLDLGMARRLSYYTGMTFRAYTPDFGQPLVGGGRYDGALLPHAAGFTIGLERLLRASPNAQLAQQPLVVSLDDVPARILRRAGYSVERSLFVDEAQTRVYAKTKRIPFLLTERGLEPLQQNHVLYADLLALLSEGYA